MPTSQRRGAVALVPRPPPPVERGRPRRPAANTGDAPSPLVPTPPSSSVCRLPRILTDFSRGRRHPTPPDDWTSSLPPSRHPRPQPFFRLCSEDCAASPAPRPLPAEPVRSKYSTARPPLPPAPPKALVRLPRLQAKQFRAALHLAETDAPAPDL
eukprot:EG_transcript_18018